ncbi:M1 family metallopeptidase [Nocardioides sp. CER19]|uniref:M1 family metallopeptidase n=1 Tax=Nocardioides sp. CER19 TaxID=3038538 RepID=UPI00244A8A3E|nr:M1 family metallopeptidase [Nocardioides sp. CER19]MDH2414118.1 M1 family metallopeptidase [Nocardioides sp. CER19]
MSHVRTLLSAATALVASVALAVPAGASPGSRPETPAPGAAGIGDPYFPTEGNGGYDVQHYGIVLDYRPATDLLRATTTITARATQALSAFNLDFHALTVRSVRVDGSAARFSRSGDELTVTPRHALKDDARFTVVVSYDGVPQAIDDPALGLNGWINTDDGALVAGQPYGAATWFPVNDHPLDKASYSFSATVPRGLQAVANGSLVSRRDHGGSTTWRWEARDPMASYLATVDIGRFDLSSRRVQGIHYLDAADPDLDARPVSAADGTTFAWSQQADSSYKRLAHTFAIPAGATGAAATLSFLVNRSTQPNRDYAFVEAAPSGTDDWTTLADTNGHTTQRTGNAVCADLLGEHPFLAHYLSDPGDGAGCDPTGTTGEWHAASGAGAGWERWGVDLSAYAGRSVEVAITYLTDSYAERDGVSVDAVVGPGGQGSTSFEDGTLDGWTVPGSPEANPNPNDWVATTTGPPPIGRKIRASLAREPEIVAFLSSQFGRYPWRESGAIIDDLPIGFALETQTRPVYSPLFWYGGPADGDSVIVHELAHQWYGDSVAVARWQDIWLNEGFATYAEWLWGEHEGLFTPQEAFDDRLAGIPPDDEFWQLPIGDPGPADLFDGPVYDRGAMTLQALRNRIGDRTFFTLLRRWASEHRDGNGTTPQFIALAERLSGQQLDGLFDTWLSAGFPGAAAGAPTLRAPAAASTGLAAALQAGAQAGAPRK